MAKSINSFAVIGGDLRQLYCARSAADDGFGIYLAGFDLCKRLQGFENLTVREALSSADAVILPLPVSKDGKSLYAPFSEAPIEAASLLKSIPEEIPVFTGMNGKLPAEWISRKHLYCYSDREEFAAANALPTAEGAIAAAMAEYDGTISGANILVIGYGRIGRVLSRILWGMGASVTVSARKLQDQELIRAGGMKPMPTGELTGQYDIIFNTVPAMVLDREKLSACAANALVIDLASLPGGIDDEAAARMSIRVIHALSLPGKAAPKSAGQIIKNAVYNIIREEFL